MAEKMKSMLDHLEHFIEVLALSRSVHVKDWDILHVQRALEWGDYFQHVHRRFAANKPLRKSIEAHLRVKNHELACHMKNYHHVGFDHLGTGRRILCMSLLQNNALPDPLLKYVTDLVQNSDSMGVDSTSLTHILSQKLTSELLLSLPLLSSNEVHEPLDNPVLMTQADLLRSRLEGILEVSEDNQKSSIVSEFLGRISKPHVFQLIVAILLSHEVLACEPRDMLPDLLLDWVLSNDDLYVGFFMSVPSNVLARLSFMFSKFMNVYVDHLVNLGNSMEQDLTCGKWVSNHFKLSFDGLLDRYNHLMEGPENVKDSLLTKLRSLKSQDGDYDVPGISIWTDILVGMRTT